VKLHRNSINFIDEIKKKQVVQFASITVLFTMKCKKTTFKVPVAITNTTKHISRAILQ